MADTVGEMMAIRRRIIERVPAVLVGLLEVSNRLPLLPAAVKEVEACAGQRSPLLAEVAALTWIAEWHGDRIDTVSITAPIGIAAFRDVYEYSSGRDVREVVHIAGTRRSVVELIKWMRVDAGSLPLIGSVHRDNGSMNDLLEQLPAVARRVTWEFPPCLS